MGEMRKEFERAEDRYSQDIERLTERLQNVQFQYEKAKTEKEKIELQSLKLTRDLERTTLDLDELRVQRGIEESTNLEERKESERMARKLEEIHARYDRAVLETKSLAEDKERFEIEARKYRN